MSTLERMSRFNGSIYSLWVVLSIHAYSRAGRQAGTCIYTRRSGRRYGEKLYGVAESKRHRGMKREKEARLVVEFMGNGWRGSEKVLKPRGADKRYVKQTVLPAI